MFTQHAGGTAMTKRIARLAGALIVLAAAASSNPPATSAGDFQLQSTIAFTSTRDNPTGNPLLAAEIYLMNDPRDWSSEGQNLRRLTNNAYGDGFPTLSPDGKKIVFDSNRCLFAVGGCPAEPQFDTAGNPITSEPLNTSDLFVMNTDGTEQTRLTRGSSATWSPDSKQVAFHASASYYASGGLVTGLPIRTDPGSATRDSDIFVVNADDLLTGVAHQQSGHDRRRPGLVPGRSEDRVHEPSGHRQHARLESRGALPDEPRRQRPHAVDLQ
jgi:hypothetical protein